MFHLMWLWWDIKHKWKTGSDMSDRHLLECIEEAHEGSKSSLLSSTHTHTFIHDTCATIRITHGAAKTNFIQKISASWRWAGSPGSSPDCSSNVLFHISLFTPCLHISTIPFSILLKSLLKMKLAQTAGLTIQNTKCCNPNSSLSELTHIQKSATQ